MTQTKRNAKVPALFLKGKKKREPVKAKVRFKVGLPGYKPESRVKADADEIYRIMSQYLDRIGCPRYDELELRGFVSRKLLDYLTLRTKNKVNRTKKKNWITFATVEEWTLAFFKRKQPRLAG